MTASPAPVPAIMPAVEITRPGGPEVLVPTTRPVPQPGNGEVLIQVAAAGVNRPDIIQRQGNYPPVPGISDLPGLEVAGRIVALGAGVPDALLGQEVTALLGGGGYAGFATAPLPQCLPVPRGLSLIEAAALPETVFTVWTNLFDGGRLEWGQTLLVHGGSSGIGTAAIQIGRAFGARVFATAGSPDKCAACVALGAEAAIDYRTEDFVTRLRDLTGGRGVDVVLDMVGGSYVARDLQIMAPGGRHVSIASLGGAEAALPIFPMMARRAVFTGSTLRPRSIAEKGRIADALRAHVWPVIEAGRIRPVIHCVFPLAQAAAAHALMESSAHIGKIMLQPDP